MPQLVLAQALRLRIEQPQRIPSLAQIAMMELTKRQIADLLEEIFANIENDRGNDGNDGNDNYFNTTDFRDKARKKSGEDIDNPVHEFAILEDLSVEAVTAEIRAKIVEALENLKCAKPDRFSQMFSERLLQSLDWATGIRQRIIEHLVMVQSDYVLQPDNKLILNPQTQEDVAEVVELAASSVARLVKSLLVSFPDQSVHPVSSLIPGNHIDSIRGKYALSQLKNDPDFFDPKNGWRKSREKIADELRRRFGLDYARRTVNKYIEASGDSSLYGTRKNKIIIEVDEIIARYMQKPDLFDSSTNTWKLRVTEIRQVIRAETGFEIPKLWIESLKFANCGIQCSATLWQRVVLPKSE